MILDPIVKEEFLKELKYLDNIDKFEYFYMSDYVIEHTKFFRKVMKHLLDSVEVKEIKDA